MLRIAILVHLCCRVQGIKIPLTIESGCLNLNFPLCSQGLEDPPPGSLQMEHTALHHVTKRFRRLLSLTTTLPTDALLSLFPLLPISIPRSKRDMKLVT